MEYGVFFAACILASVPFADALKRKLPPSVEKLKYVIYAVLMAASVSYVVKGSYNPFIYFNF
jgi:alginate O-acetyltransferase complex protein AlgI